MRVAGSASRHGVSTADALHAERTAFVTIREGEKDGTWIALKIGYSLDIYPILEVAVLDPYSDDPVLIHAMILRKNYRRFVPEQLKPKEWTQ